MFVFSYSFCSVIGWQVLLLLANVSHTLLQISCLLTEMKRSSCFSVVLTLLSWQNCYTIDIPVCVQALTANLWLYALFGDIHLPWSALHVQTESEINTVSKYFSKGVVNCLNIVCEALVMAQGKKWFVSRTLFCPCPNRPEIIFCVYFLAWVMLQVPWNVG